MKMSIKFVANKEVVKRIERAELIALEKTAEAILDDLANIKSSVPHDSGHLEESGHIITDDSGNGKAAVCFDTPYARRLYFHPEFNFSKVKNPNAKGRWMDEYLPGGSDEKFAQETYAMLLKKYSRGGIK